MGHQIAFQCAGHGVDVVLYDIDAVALDSAPGRIATYAQGLIADGVVTEVRDEAMTGGHDDERPGGSQAGRR